MADPNQLNWSQLKQELDHLRQQGHLEEAIAKAAAVAEQQRQAVGEKHPDFATALGVLASLYQAAGNYDQARRLFPWALQIKQKALGPNNPDVAVLQRHLGSLSLAQGQLGRAETYLTQALTIQLASPAAPLDLAQTQHVLGQLRLAQGRYTEAEATFYQTLALRQANLPPNHPDTAQTLHQSARLYHRQGNYLRAQAVYEQVLEIRRTVLPERHPDLGESLNDLAQLQHDLGHYADAEQLYFEARAIRLDTLKPEQPEYAADLDRLAALYLDWGYYDRAEKYYRQAQTQREQQLGQRHPDFARSVENLAHLSYLRGDYDQANGLQQWAVQLKQQTLGRTHLDLAGSLDLWGQIAQAQGRYTWAGSRFEEALAIRRTALGESHPDLATSLNHLAGLFQAMGDYAEAGPRYQQALRLRQAALSPTHPDLATRLDNLAEFYHAIADEAQAEPLFRQALDLRRASLGDSHPATAESLYNLAATCYAQGDATTAKPLFEQALVLRQAALGQEHPTVAQTLTGLADTYRDLSNFDEAEPLYHQARQIWEKSGGDKHPDFARALFHLAELYHLQGKFDQAKNLYQWAGQIQEATLGESHPEVAQTLNHLAALYPLLGFVPLALQTVQKAAASYDQLLGLVFSVGSERQRLLYWQTSNQNFDAFLSLLVRHFAGSAEAVRSAFDMILRRKALGVEALAIQREALLSRGNPTLAARLEELKTLRQQIAQKTLAGPGVEPLSIYRQTLADWTRQREQLESELAQQIPEMNLTQQLQQVDGRGVAAALPGGSALVEWVRFHLHDARSLPDRAKAPARYLAFVLTAGQPIGDNVSLIDLGEAEPIDAMIASFRTNLTGQVENRALIYGDEAEPDTVPDSRPDNDIGQKLRAALFDPLLPALGDCRRLFLAPDGDLNRLPFEVLPTAAGGYLLDDYQMSYLGVGRDLLRFGLGHPGQPAASVILADPDFNLRSRPPVVRDQIGPGRETPPAHRSTVSSRRSQDLDRAGLHFGRLPGTRTEGQQLAEMLGVTPLLADEALEGKLREVHSPRILHLATHGFFLPDQKFDLREDQPGMTVELSSANRLGRLAYGLESPLLRSGLALAGANTWLKNEPLPPEAEDGLLTAEDVTSLDLLDTRLVVLSACETGLGEVQVGEGVFGLRRAFILAGARTLVISLWQVPDQQTQELMIEFYRSILAGQSRAEALRQAQLMLKEKYPHPFYWGAFICQGEPGPLPKVNQ